MDQMGNQAKMAAGTMFPVDRKKVGTRGMKASSGSTSVLGLGHDPPGRMHWKLKKASSEGEFDGDLDSRGGGVSQIRHDI